VRMRELKASWERQNTQNTVTNITYPDRIDQPRIFVDWKESN
jgi:hypothetical protein